MNKEINVLFVVAFLVGTIFSSSYVIAQGYSTVGYGNSGTINYNTRPSFETYYSQAQIDTYWPILGDDPQECVGRTDLMLGVPPVGCEPTVVRSDLLADQDVPVFCQIDSVKINPLIDIKRVRNMVFRGERPPEVVDFGFHPARAALGTYNNLVGSPVINNVGYVVVVLKRQPIESELPESINMTLTAEIEYLAGNAYGVGRNEFILEEVSDEDWGKEKLKQSFWNGRYYVRLLYGDENYADIALYYGDSRISTVRVNKGETSKEIFMPGLYCAAGVQVRYTDFVTAEEKARIEVSSDGNFDVFDVYEGSRFLDNRCVVRKIDVNEVDGETGEAIVNCGGKDFELALKPRGSWELGEKDSPIGKLSARMIDEDYEFTVFNATTNGTDYYRLDNETNLYGYLEGESKEIMLLSRGGVYSVNITDENQKKEVKNVRDILINYKREIESSGVVKVKKQSEQYFDSAVEIYEDVVDDYSTEANGIYGKRALDNEIDLAKTFGNDVIRAKLMKKYIDVYAGGENNTAYLSELQRLDEIDFSLASQLVEFEDKPKVVSLLSLDVPRSSVSAELELDERKITLNKGPTYVFLDDASRLEGNVSELLKEDTNNKIRGQIKLDEVGVDTAVVSAYCVQNDKDNKRVISTSRQRFNLRIDDDRLVEICGLTATLENINAEKISKIEILPNVRGATTEANFTVNIGIEKRAIQLTPSKVLQKIENLNETIEKWTNINEKLGKVVSGLKTACFATAGLLTFKNFFSGLSGETIARQDVMNGPGGFKAQCEALIPTTYSSLDACYAAKSSEIDAAVAGRTTAQNQVNTVIQGIQNDPECIRSTEAFGKSVDNKCVNRKIAAKIREEFPNTLVKPADGIWQGEEKEVSVSELLDEKYVDSLSSDQLRTLYSNLKESQAGANSRADSSNSMVVDQIDNSLVLQKALDDAALDKQKGLATAFYGDEKVKAVDIVRVGTDAKTNYAALDNEGVTPTATYVKDGNKYILGLKEQDPVKKYYSVESAMIEDKGEISDADLTKLKKSIGTLRSASSVSYNNKMLESHNVVRYYETEPYKGMPAVVPLNSDTGWYAATRQSIPAFGGIGAYDASGRVTSFWLCNVGPNGQAEVNSGYGDDVCQMINTNTGQPIGSFPGLSSSEAQNLVTQAERCIQDAARQYGNKVVDVCGARRKVGNPATDVSDSQCQDFMSPKDCLLLFNVCDPVICPSSRCNFGGTYQVADVVQTGIIGSTLLCLPNIREGIVMPVCLTGIHAGIDGLISIMRNYRDCLQENIETGQMVGVCDEIYSIYLCEFFWNEVAPFLNVLIPRLIELAYGQGVRGGAEYLSVMSAWQNMENSVNYFTQSYAVNSFNAFQAKNVQEIGTEFCKGFISVKAPTAFQTLVEPESPPQFHAYFSEAKFTTATVPSTSQYKVFYHIYAGNDQGTSFQVYLKSPPESSYYQTAPYVNVGSGFIPAGEYASETRDFTAPSGYKELCVRINNEEHCDFKQVSSSFAVNYLRDEYVQGELENSNIQSEKDCISGQTNPAALVNPNLQAGAQEALNPAIYNRGVVRICSTGNPGSGTDPSRFVRVGNCGDTAVGCWLDKTSVDKALTDANVGAREETLEELERVQQEYLNGGNDMLTQDQAEGEIEGFEAELKRLRETYNSPGVGTSLASESSTLIESIDFTLKKVFFSSQRAHLMVLKGDVYKLLAELEFRKDSAARQAAVSGTVGAGADEEEGGDTSAYMINRGAVYYLNSQDVVSISNIQTGVLLDSARKTVFVAGQEVGVYNESGTIEIEDAKIEAIIAENPKQIGPLGRQTIKDIDGKTYTELKEKGISISVDVNRFADIDTSDAREVITETPTDYEFTISNPNAASGEDVGLLKGNAESRYYINGNFVYTLDSSGVPVGSYDDVSKTISLFDYGSVKIYFDSRFEYESVDGASVRIEGEEPASASGAAQDPWFKQEKCELRNLGWIDGSGGKITSAEDGQEVFMSAEITDGCKKEGSQVVSFQIFEKDAFTDDWLDFEDDSIDIQAVNSGIEGNLVKYGILIKWKYAVDDNKDDDSVSEYYLKAWPYTKTSEAIKSDQTLIVTEGAPVQEPTALTYEVKKFEFQSNGEAVNANEGIGLNEDLSIAVEHTCGSVTIAYRFSEEGGDAVTIDDERKNFNIVDLDTEVAGHYFATIICRDSQGRTRNNPNSLESRIDLDVCPVGGC